MVKLSIVTISYNCINDLKSTMDSVKSQSYSDYEYIVIDGGSSDGTNELLIKSSIVDKYISEPDGGIYDAMNKGVELAEGEYILFLNAGDTFCSKCILNEAVRFLSGDEDIIYGNALRDTPEGFVKFKNSKLSDITFGMVFCHQAVFTKAELFKNKAYSLDYKIAGDYEFYLRGYLLGATFKYVDLDIAVIDNEGVSNTRKFRSTIERYRIVKKAKVLTWRLYFKFSYYLFRALLSDFLRKVKVL
ncbi:glycosyltransferase family 2 protein [Pseudoalteromonas shioyasakiensis]|uniref:glycosyltransferase family 2 protein n=1 Tax=Pseudoalteromonas shioyasakiensis TaxID=1190813 RepID=UPI0007852A24|nr:glycosyltransferase family 2 protein [Pseudoalteromonas shioyasakiensis]